MPPKASKADVAKKQKVVEDKTFGLKNKNKNKSKSVQKYVQQIKSSVQPKVDPTKAKKKKEEEKAKEKELNDLFKVAVSQPKVPPGMSYVLSKRFIGSFYSTEVLSIGIPHFYLIKARSVGDSRSYLTNLIREQIVHPHFIKTYL